MMYPRAEAILQEIAEKYGVTVVALCSKRRFKTLVRARREVVERCHNELEMSLGEIGWVLGGKDHTTIRNALKGEQTGTG